MGGGGSGGSGVIYFVGEGFYAVGVGFRGVPWAARLPRRTEQSVSLWTYFIPSRTHRTSHGCRRAGVCSGAIFFVSLSLS